MNLHTFKYVLRTFESIPNFFIAGSYSLFDTSVYISIIFFPILSMSKFSPSQNYNLV